VGFNHLAARAVVDGGVEDGFEILNEGAVAPDIEGLCAVADGEDWLVEIEGVLEQELVDGGSGSVGRAAGGDGFFTVALRATSKPLPGRRTPWTPVRRRATRSGVSWSGTITAWAPADWRAAMYCGRARWLYSVSDEVGSGMAMRTDIESLV